MKTGWHGKEWGSSPPFPSSVPGMLTARLGPSQAGGRRSSVWHKLTQEWAVLMWAAPRKTTKVPNFTVTSSSMHTALKKPFKLPS